MCIYIIPFDKLDLSESDSFAWLNFHVVSTSPTLNHINSFLFLVSARIISYTGR